MFDPSPITNHSSSSVITTDDESYFHGEGDTACCILAKLEAPIPSPRVPHFAFLPSSTESAPQLAEMNVEKLTKMAGSVRTGGKGTMRRKKKAVHKTTTTDDKRLQSTLKRIGVNAIPAIEEVNIFKEDVVIQFVNPKVQASIAANTWVVSGSPQTKKLQDILPQIIHQLGPDNMENLKKLAEQFQKQAPGAGEGSGANLEQEDDEDDVPALVSGETFEAAAEEGHTS
ncbi:basic transcription factor 3 [Abeliophyllum distichum]|uniref:Nascent polypeptide-associated complex subunit beta n=1 Tax=Abeliophyllum distichum TaxID=126358 RepID=A0ABD1SFW8_9LAMI